MASNHIVRHGCMWLQYPDAWHVDQSPVGAGSVGVLLRGINISATSMAGEGAKRRQIECVPVNPPSRGKPRRA